MGHYSSKAIAEKPAIDKEEYINSLVAIIADGLSANTENLTSRQLSTLANYINDDPNLDSFGFSESICNIPTLSILDGIHCASIKAAYSQKDDEVLTPLSPPTEAEFNKFVGDLQRGDWYIIGLYGNFTPQQMNALKDIVKAMPNCVLGVVDEVICVRKSPQPSPRPAITGSELASDALGEARGAA